MTIKYESQKIAQHFYTFAVLLFLVQVLVGIIAAIQFIKPDVFILNFNIIRSLHINALVVWLLVGFMGVTYYVISDESDTELWSLPLAKFQFWATVVTITLVVLGYIWMGISPQANSPINGINPLNEGREYIEAPRWADYLIVVSVLLFLLNCFMTVLKTKKWTGIQGVLLGGLVFLALMYLPGLFYTKSMVKDQFWWWWVVHLWVEGSWEIIAGALLAFMLMKTTGAKREVLEKWMYIEVGLVLFTGILGTGHHYYWIGTPKYWLWVGGIFSSLEPIPLLLMVWDAFRTTREARNVTNRPGLFYTVAHAIFNFVGAGLWGIIHTLPQVNKWTHGTQVTTAHGHLAFYGAYVLLVISMIYVTLPSIRGVKEYNPSRAYLSFWWMTISMVFIVLTITGAGMVQTYMERLMGLDYVAVKTTYNLWFWILRAIFGVGFLIGVGIFVVDFFKLGKEPMPVVSPAPEKA
ncbi:MAG: cbb3-type cytochrome c oxidase subunit I [Nitrospirae bacterium]|nr:cbb3-type cytochrome c oxidase subunit I [Nitrospirota bacterium]MCL5421856.1 cbb3-type cytochrome c oxidase subunit I [Nitrospirota bacterium]